MKLEQMQKPTKNQLEEMIDDKVNSKIESTIPNEVRTILDRSLKSQSFITHNLPKSASATTINSNETQKSDKVGVMTKSNGKGNTKRVENKLRLLTYPQLLPTLQMNLWKISRRIGNMLWQFQ